VLHLWQMGNTLTVRLPKELIEEVRGVSRRTGLPVSRVVRQSLETTLAKAAPNPLLEFAGVVKGGPRNVSSRKGFSSE
jgi:predicted DNA-binding protein